MKVNATKKGALLFKEMAIKKIRTNTKIDNHTHENSIFQHSLIWQYIWMPTLSSVVVL